MIEASALRPALLAVLLLGPGATLQAQSNPRPAPFAVGEALVYRVRAGRLGTIGRASMRVEGPEVVRGHTTYLLRFDFRGKVGFFTVEDRTRSWLCPEQMASVRYEKHERQPFSSHHEEVELYPDERRWKAADGAAGESPTDAPLDELSFLYYLRTLPLVEGETYTLDRHFHAERNPVVARVLRREAVTVAAGTYSTLVVEMRVKDRKRYGGEGVLHLYIADDERRYPVRIESSMPLVGKMVLELEAPAVDATATVQG